MPTYKTLEPISSTQVISLEPPADNPTYSPDTSPTAAEELPSATIIVNKIQSYAYGTSGDDIFDFQNYGNMSVIGYSGDDSYIIRQKTINIIEKYNGGVDTIYCLADNYAMTDNTENIVLAGTENLSCAGNYLGNNMFGNSGNNNMMGGKGFDIIRGNAGDDTLKGGRGDDQLFGEMDNDTLSGDKGNDTLIGGQGADVLWGGIGKDNFVFTTASDSSIIEMDIIEDFETGSDKMDFSQMEAEVSSKKNDIVRLSTTGGLTLESVLNDAAEINDTDNGLSWFAYQGDTIVYIESNGSGSTFDPDNDVVVTLTGEVNINQYKDLYFGVTDN